ncbi:redoxin domain-containing protein [Acetobacteraceae bacterium KSS8]|uniref:Glutathione peroxidase n=1 Tax=Endosaccharibacter trunci TaxID=2812733 RepID=A0ABT1W9W5_9PROT|nr:redoxin domain-containing protein [Acetobacteraceae bacterium KSS8]
MPDLMQTTVTTIDGQDVSLSDYAGKVLLVVNVASKCGLTPQYEALEQLYRRDRDRGLVVLGFPCNQFREQEPGSDAEIAAFCSTTYGVSFPMFSRIEVNGPGRHPLYRDLLSQAPQPIESEGGGMRARLAKHGIAVDTADVMWNFEKFLVGRDGRVLARFAPDITVDDPVLAGAIEQALAA